MQVSFSFHKLCLKIDSQAADEDDSEGDIDLLHLDEFARPTHRLPTITSMKKAGLGLQEEDELIRTSFSRSSFRQIRRLPRQFSPGLTDQSRLACIEQNLSPRPPFSPSARNIDGFSNFEFHSDASSVPAASPSPRVRSSSHTLPFIPTSARVHPQMLDQLKERFVVLRPTSTSQSHRRSHPKKTPRTSPFLPTTSFKHSETASVSTTTSTYNRRQPPSDETLGETASIVFKELKSIEITVPFDLWVDNDNYIIVAFHDTQKIRQSIVEAIIDAAPVDSTFVEVFDGERMIQLEVDADPDVIRRVPTVDDFQRARELLIARLHRAMRTLCHRLTSIQPAALLWGHSMPLHPSDDDPVTMQARLLFSLAGHWCRDHRLLMNDPKRCQAVQDRAVRAIRQRCQV